MIPGVLQVVPMLASERIEVVVFEFFDSLHGGVPIACAGRDRRRRLFQHDDLDVLPDERPEFGQVECFGVQLAGEYARSRRTLPFKKGEFVP